MTDKSRPPAFGSLGWRRFAFAALPIVLLIALLIQIANWRLRTISTERNVTPPSAAKIAILPDGVVMFAPDGTIARRLVDWLDSQSRDPRYFEVGGRQFVGRSIDPTPAAKKRLKTLVDMLDAYAKVRVTIIGHTTASGLPKADRLVSELRAKHVVDLLVEAGISRDRLAAEGRGAEQPLPAGTPGDDERIGLLLSNPA